MVSLWSPNPYYEDDELDTDQNTCGDGAWGANCMGAPCYAVAYNSTPQVFNTTCVCPVKAFPSLAVHETSSDVCSEAALNSRYTGTVRTNGMKHGVKMKGKMKME